MIPRVALTISVLVLTFSLSWGDAGYSHFDTKTAEKMMFSAINQIRLNNGLPLLKRNEKLAKAARLHASDMVRRNFFEHFNPDGEGPRERALDLGLPYPVSENLGVLSSFGLTLEDVVNELLKSLMESPQHRANILNPNITDIGISFAQDKEDITDFVKIEKSGSHHLGFGTVVVCQEFMKKGLESYNPEPFPKEIKKGDLITLNGTTYKDFDTVLIELVEKEKNRSVKKDEVVLFERSFEEKLHFFHGGNFNLKIVGNLYKNNTMISEELVTFQVAVD